MTNVEFKERYSTIQQTEKTSRIIKRAERFIEDVDRCENGIPDNRLMFSIDLFIRTYEFYFEGFFAKCAQQDYPPEHPFDYSDYERRIKDGCRYDLSEPFGRQCENLAAAIACANPTLSGHLYVLAQYFEQHECDRVPGLWMAIHGGLRCSLAQLIETATKPPALNERHILMREIIEDAEEHLPGKEIIARVKEQSPERDISIISDGRMRADLAMLVKHYGVKRSSRGYYAD